MTDLILRSVFDTHGYTRPVKDGTVKIDGVSLDIVEVPLLTNVMRNVADYLEFDLGEITMVDYIMARSLGKPLVALPIFVNRSFQFHRMMYNARSGIRTPKDLEGKRVGVKSYTQTAPVWGRGILAMQGVDLDKITWVNIEGPHVGDFRNPPNVVPAPGGRSLAQMLESGEIDAADDPGRPWRNRGETWQCDPEVIRPLVPDVRQAVADWYGRTQVYPILHVLVAKRDVISSNPGTARALFEAFAAAKRIYMASISEADRRFRWRDIVGLNFLPYGVSPNRATLEMLCDFCHGQKITPQRYRIEDLFDAEMMALQE